MSDFGLWFLVAAGAVSIAVQFILHLDEADQRQRQTRLLEAAIRELSFDLDIQVSDMLRYVREAVRTKKKAKP